MSDDRSAAASDGVTCSSIPHAVPLTRFRLFAIAVRFAGRRGDCDVRCFCQLEFPHSLCSSPFVSSFFVAAVALYVFVLSYVSDGVVSGRCVVVEMRAV